MLIVIGIIAVLLGLLYGALERARKFSRYTIAYSELKQIQAAFEQYYAHYGVWPAQTNNPSITFFDSEDGEDAGFEITREIADALQGVSKGGNDTLFHDFNPDGIPFIEFTQFEDSHDHAPRNPFKPTNSEDTSRRFMVLFDTSGNHQIYVPADDKAPGSEATNIVANVAVWTVVPGLRSAQTAQGGTPQPAGDMRLGSWDAFNFQRPAQSQ
ncbi:MAG: type II secretion system GspH family protein [Kiritimatiellaeota bacterium]|nr:type II secretion system GspH family protein [Kiritimatiellota bacterium]